VRHCRHAGSSSRLVLRRRHQRRRCTMPCPPCSGLPPPAAPRLPPHNNHAPARSLHSSRLQPPTQPPALHPHLLELNLFCCITHPLGLRVSDTHTPSPPPSFPALLHRAQVHQRILRAALPPRVRRRGARRALCLVRSTGALRRQGGRAEPLCLLACLPVDACFGEGRRCLLPAAPPGSPPQPSLPRLATMRLPSPPPPRLPLRPSPRDTATCTRAPSAGTPALPAKQTRAGSWCRAGAARWPSTAAACRRSCRAGGSGRRSPGCGWRTITRSWVRCCCSFFLLPSFLFLPLHGPYRQHPPCPPCTGQPRAACRGPTAHTTLPRRKLRCPLRHPFGRPLPRLCCSPLPSPTVMESPCRAAGWLDGVEQSLLYCPSHPLGANGQALFLLPPADRRGRRRAAAPYRLIRSDLRRAALLHYARQHRHLSSSRRLLAEVRPFSFFPHCSDFFSKSHIAHNCSKLLGSLAGHVWFCVCVARMPSLTAVPPPPSPWPACHSCPVGGQPALAAHARKLRFCSPSAMLARVILLLCAAASAGEGEGGAGARRSHSAGGFGGGGV
jgi:hypothetical protein